LILLKFLPRSVHVLTRPSEYASRSTVRGFYQSKRNLEPKHDIINHECAGQIVAANVWFSDADSRIALREMKILADRYGSVLTLLVLPRSADVWGPWKPRG